MKKIALVQVNDIIGTNVILPLAIGVLWQYVKKRIQKKWILKKIVYKKICDDEISKLAECDVVCFSNYVWNTNYHVELAKKIKSINSQVFIVVGGPNVSPDKTDFWENYSDIIDLAIVGEGEHVFEKFLLCWPDIPEISGIWTKNYFGGISDRVKDFSINASPYLSGFYDQIVQEELNNGNLIQAVIQTNRGCPYHCSFCEEGQDYKNKMFFYDIERIKKEIEWCAQNKIEYLSIADDNWGIADRDIDVMKWISECKIRYGYPGVMDATYAKNNPENLLAMAEIDKSNNTNLIRGITIALQSMNEPTLQSIKRFNLMPAKQQKLIKGLDDLGIPTYTEIIWPLPYETFSTFKHGLQETIHSGMKNWLAVYPLSLHPGTELYQQFHKNFGQISQQSENANRQGTKEIVNIVNSSDWVDNKTLIKGQVLYAWIVCLYYFGFARNILESTDNIVETVDNFTDWLESHKESKCHRYYKQIQKWWYSWSNGDFVPDLSIFPDQDTTHWSPYTHLASWLQFDRQSLYDDLNRFGLDSLYDMDSSVIYGQSYPYINQKNKTIYLSHQQPKFKNRFEFCRFYYWWKRKSGASRSLSW